MKNEKYSSFDQNICFAVYSTSLAILQVYKKLLNSIGLTYPQYLIMVALFQRDGQTVSDLAKGLLQDPGSLSPTLMRMENENLITRRRSVEDQRQVLIYLTEYGKSLNNKFSEIDRNFTGLCNLSDLDKKNIIDSLLELRGKIIK